MESGGGDVELPGATHASPVPGGVSGGKRRNSPTNPDPAAVFRGVRVLLEQQNGGDKSGSEQVCGADTAKRIRSPCKCKCRLPCTRAGFYCSRF